MLPRIVLITFLCLLAVATSAAAECAWVLWYRAAQVDEKGALVGEWTSWVPQGVSTEPSGCERLVQSNDSATMFRATGLKPSPGVKVILAHQCLPDTVDPRGRKGK